MSTIKLNLVSGYGHTQTSIEQINLTPKKALKYFIGASFFVTLENEELEFICTNTELIQYEN